MEFYLSKTENGKVVGKDHYNYVPITADNYAERVANMNTLAPEWKSLDNAPIGVKMLFDPAWLFAGKTKLDDHLFGFLTDERVKEFHSILSENEQNYLNEYLLFMDIKPEDIETQAEAMIREQWERRRFPVGSIGRDIVKSIEDIIGYKFKDEYICAQAFTSKSFFTGNKEDMWKCPDVDQDNEVLEFIGDSALNSVVTNLIRSNYCHIYPSTEESEVCVLMSDVDENAMSKIRSKFICKDYLVSRGIDLGLDKYIRKSEDDIKADVVEDAMEALIGAVAVDSDWNQAALTDVVLSLLDVHFKNDGEEETQIELDDIINIAKKELACTPTVKYFKTDKKSDKGYSIYRCEITITNPGVTEADIKQKAFSSCLLFNSEEMYHVSDDTISFVGEDITKGKARSHAASTFRTILNLLKLLTKSVKLSEISPDHERAVNQVQELWQKGYIGEPSYKFLNTDGFERAVDFIRAGLSWYCECRVANSDIYEYAYGVSKADAKKSAAYNLLIRLMRE